MRITWVTSNIVGPGMIGRLKFYFEIYFFFCSLVDKFVFRSSHWRYFIKIGVLKNFIKFTGKHLRRSLFFSIASLGKRHRHRCFPVNLVKFLRISFLQNTFWRLLLYFYSYSFTFTYQASHLADFLWISCSEIHVKCILFWRKILFSFSYFRHTNILYIIWLSQYYNKENGMSFAW